MPLEIVRVEESRGLSNAYLVYEASSGEAIIVDTGAPAEAVLEPALRRGARVRWILNTHFHADHVAANETLARALGAPVAAHRLEIPRIPSATVALEDGQVLEVGGMRVEVVHIPGHTSGQAAFLVGSADLFTGDTLFRGSVGGTMAPGASGFADLRRSLLGRILALPDATRVHPGHSVPTTIGEERRGNPFLRVMLGLEPPGSGRCLAFGRPARLLVQARDYDGGTKAWVRFDDDGVEATVPGSRVEAL